MTSPHIAGLYIHPVKSAAGFACESARLTATGLEHDREWMIVDAQGRFLTQRDLPQLSQLRTAIEAGELRLSLPSGERLSLPVDHEGAPVSALVWRSRCAAFDAGDEAAAFIGDFLGRAARLVRFDPAGRRLSNPDWTAGREVPTLFSDGYPLLVLSQGSIDDLSARVGRTLVPERFRPNILLAGVEAYAEDAATALDAGEAQFRLTKACTRCVITTLDPSTGERQDDEPLATLRQYRLDRALRGVVFGRNAYAVAGAGGVIRRGQPISLTHDAA